MKNKYILILSAIAIVFISGCAENREPLKIGVIAPLSGPDTIWGERMQQGIDLASQGKDIEVRYEDGVCKPQESVTAIRKLMEIDNITIIIGEACSSATLAIAPIAQENGVILVSPSSTDPRIPKIGNFIFRTWYSNTAEIEGLADFLEASNYSKVALLYTLNEWGENRKSTLVSSFNGTLISEGHEKDAADMRTPLIKIRQKNPDAIVIFGYTNDMLLALKQMKELNISKPLFTTTTVEDPTFLELSGNLSDGIIYFSPDIKISGSFRSDYMEKYGKEPHQTAATSYDSFNILYDAIMSVGPDSRKIAEYMENLNYSGASGELSFDNDGDVRRAVIAKIIKNQKPENYGDAQ